MKNKRFEVSWVETHSVELEAENEEEAKELAWNNARGCDTCQNVGQEEVREIREGGE